MKVDMNKLMEQPPRKPCRGLVIGLTSLMLCLCLAAGGIVAYSVSNKSGVLAEGNYDRAEANPSFTVQQVADVTVPDAETGGIVGYDGELVQCHTSLYKDYVTDWNTANTIGQMALAGDGFQLKEVWFGYDASSENESDFAIAEVNGDMDSIILTNNSENASLSAVKDGRYVQSGDNTYTICVADGMVVRLVFEEAEDWTYEDASVYDYDITDGGYYLEDDWYSKGALMATSAAADEEGAVYIDAVAGGINSESNYKASGTKLVFGSEGTGTDGADALGFGLVAGLDAYGNIRWADDISAPSLFNGSAKGKTEYDDNYSLGFAVKGYNKTLSCVESEWGTAADGLDSVGEFWIVDDAPSSGTDGHDLLWGEGSGIWYYRSDDRAPMQLEAEGEAHNRYFGLKYTEDFVLEPGYTGPMSVLAMADDDLWVLAARIGEDGRVITDSVVTVMDLGGTQAGRCYMDMWDVIDPVEYGEEAQEWRLFIFYLERDGEDASLYLNMSLPKEGRSVEAREARSIELTAEDNGAAGDERWFMIKDAADNLYTVTYADGSEKTVAVGVPFTVPDGASVLLDGFGRDDVVAIAEEGTGLCWSSAGDGYAEGSTMQVEAGGSASFLSSEEDGVVTLGANGPNNTYLFTLHLDGHANAPVPLMSEGLEPKGTLFTDKDGEAVVSVKSGEKLLLYGLPEDISLYIVPEAVEGERVAEIVIDDAIVDGSVVMGGSSAYADYTFEKE